MGFKIKKPEHEDIYPIIFMISGVISILYLIVKLING